MALKVLLKFVNNPNNPEPLSVPSHVKGDTFLMLRGHDIASNEYRGLSLCVQPTDKPMVVEISFYTNPRLNGRDEKEEGVQCVFSMRLGDVAAIRIGTDWYTLHCVEQE